MNKKTGFIAALALAIATVGALFSPATGGQESQRAECQQACTKTYQECRRAPNANHATCKTAFDECRKNCQDVGPKPSPEVSPSPSPAVSPSPSPGV
jgi:hypothetical protein